jgi:flagellar hook-associated protein 1 FlgK
VIHEDISSVAEPTEAANLLDLRDELVGEIAQLVDVRVIEQDTGTVMIMLDGNPLIQETEVNELKVIPKKPLDGAMDTTTAISEQLVDVVLKQPGQTRDVTIRGGAIAGLLRMQDEIIPQTLKNLDRFAYTFVRQINSVHQSGRGLTGSNGQSLFQFNLPDANGTVSYGTNETAPPESQPPSRVAATIKMAPEVAGNLNLIATAKGTARGENENALEMVSLQNALFFEEGTLSFTDFYNTSVASLGGLSDENERRVNTTQLVRDQLEARWQSVSGVSLDEELVTMMQYQSIFEAAARMMSTIDQMTDTVINRMAPR